MLNVKEITNIITFNNISATRYIGMVGFIGEGNRIIRRKTTEPAANQ
jgi:hypothetical protein